MDAISTGPKRLSSSRGTTDAAMVENGVARSETSKWEIAADELLAYVALAKRLETRKLTLADWMNHIMRDVHATILSFALEKVVTYLFSREFSVGVRLDSIVSFEGVRPPWGSSHARLVVVGKNSPRSTTPSSVQLWNPAYRCDRPINHAVECEDTERSIEWLDDPSGVPILLPCKRFGPDLIFVLQLDGGKLLWVVVQCQYQSKGRLRKVNYKRAVRAVTPCNLFKTKVRSGPFSFTARATWVLIHRTCFRN